LQQSQHDDLNNHSHSTTLSLQLLVSHYFSPVEILYVWQVWAARLPASLVVAQFDIGTIDYNARDMPGWDYLTTNFLESHSTMSTSPYPLCHPLFAPLAIPFRPSRHTLSPLFAVPPLPDPDTNYLELPWAPTCTGGRQQMQARRSRSSQFG